MNSDLKKNLNIFICPGCKSSLEKGEGGLICSRCNKVYKIQDGVIDFLIELPTEESKVSNIEYMDKEADFYDKIHLHMSNTSHEKKMFRNLVQKFSNVGEIILDVATGTGFVLDNFGVSEKNKKFICLDISQNMLKRVMQKHKNKIIFALRADAEYLPIQNNSIGIVTISSSLHHLPHPTKSIGEMYRVLIPMGILIIFHEPLLGEANNFLFRVFRKFFYLMTKFIPRNEEREKKIKEYAKEIFGAEEEVAFSKMEEYNKQTNVQDGLNPFNLLNKKNWDILETKIYYPKETIFNKLMGILFPNNGELFYLIARKK